MGVAYRCPACDVRVVVLRTLKLGKGGKKVVRRFRSIDNPATPDSHSWKSFEVEAGDDSEITLTSFESCEKIGPGGRICVYNLSASKDDFEIDNCITSPAILRREE
jgi:hypothetical protein